MLHRFILSTLLFYSLVVFTACEGNTDYDRVIQNDTDQTIEVTVKPESQPEKSYTVSPGEGQLLFSTTQSGGQEDAINPSDAIESMLVTKNQFEVLSKDFRNPDNWNTTIEKTRNLPANYVHNYTLIVNNSDF